MIWVMINKPEDSLVKFGTGPNNKLTQKYARVKKKDIYVHTHIVVCLNTNGEQA